MYQRPVPALCQASGHLPPLLKKAEEENPRNNNNNMADLKIETGLQQLVYCGRRQAGVGQEEGRECLVGF